MNKMKPNNVKIMFYLTYKWTTYQAPVRKPLKHLIQSIQEKEKVWKDKKLEFQISPFVDIEKKVYYMPILDIEEVDYKYYNREIFNCYCFTGKGIHLFSNKLFLFENIEKDLKALKEINYKSKIDFVTSYRTVPIRFFNSFSSKYNIWLWKRVKPVNDTKKLFDEGLDEDYKTDHSIVTEIINFLSNIKIVGTINDFIKTMNKI